MAYLGSKPSSGFITTAKQRITSSTNNYVDLDNAISSLADVIVWVNFVKQDSTNLTLTTSTRITLGATLVASDIVEIAYLGKAVATQTPDTGTVTNDMLSGSIANSKLANSSITLNGSAVSLGGSATVGGDNTPAFEAYSSSNQAVNDNTTTKVQCGTEVYDTASAYDNSSNYRFTPQTAGKYFCYGQVFITTSVVSSINQATAYIYKNGSVLAGTQNSFYSNPIYQFTATVSTVINFNGSSDYIELYGYFDGDEDRSGTINGGGAVARRTLFGAYKIIT
jgi:hypothetical protein